MLNVARHVLSQQEAAHVPHNAVGGLAQKCTCACMFGKQLQTTAHRRNRDRVATPLLLKGTSLSLLLRNLEAVFWVT